jgi:RNA polymerase sigma factor (sigma-70 family)
MFNDKLLVWRFNLGDRDVLRLIYDKYKHDLLTIAALILHDANAGEDVVHDVFVSFMQNRGKFRLTGSLKGYLATCVANRARNWNKATYQKNISIDRTDFPADSDYSQPDRIVVADEQFHRISGALAQLPPEQQDVIILHLHGGMTFRSIAIIQNVSINTVQGRYRYGLVELRSLLNGQVNNEIR